MPRASRRSLKIPPRSERIENALVDSLETTVAHYQDDVAATGIGGDALDNPLR
jgi:hypothetical protein